MAGAYTLSRNGHVRGDFIYRMWRPRTQGIVELSLYILFFFPGVLALVIAGWQYGVEAARIREVSVNSPVGIPDMAAQAPHPVRRRLARVAGRGRGSALHPLHPRQPLAATAA